MRNPVLELARAFTATAPYELWVADLTNVRTWSGFCFVAFVIDAFARMIVGRKSDTNMRAAHWSPTPCPD